jgi:nicotinamidase-related amidase
VKAPSFHDPKRVADVWVERAGLVSEEAARAEVKPARDDRERVCAFGIDCQIGFCTPGASLFVPGAVEDMQRTLAWLYANLERVTEIALSLDTHRLHQIFHPAFWLDAAGNAPKPFTRISAKEVKDGRFRPAKAPAEDALAYVEKLEASGKYTLMVWPFHTLLGGTSHAIVPALWEASMFHALARETEIFLRTKGSDAMTEMYSVLSAEIGGAFDRELFDRLASFDKIYVFGQAKSHCVLATLRDLRPMASKIFLLEDATSSVPGFDVRDAYEELRSAGMHFVKTTDPI